MRPTMRQVAERAGVSQVTVTNVLRGRTARTSMETRERVLRSVHELGYMPVVQPASQQRHVETKVIGVTFDQIDALQDAMGLMILQGLREGAARHGYDLLLMLRPPPDWAPGREEVLFLDRRSDGFIFVAPLNRNKVLRALVKQRIPVVSCSSMDVPSGVATVRADNADEIRQAIRHLKNLGHEKIMHLAGPKWNSDERLRSESFISVMREEGLGNWAEAMIQCQENGDWPSTEKAFQAIKSSGASAVVCCNDHAALGLWQCAQKNGWNVPADLSIVGINDIAAADHAGLTSINMNLTGMGVAAVEAWIGLQHGESYKKQSRKMPVTLMKRASTAPPKKRWKGFSCN